MHTKSEVFKKTKVMWTCPSNIAIVKYWGKQNGQIPCNPSISLTLSKSTTQMEVELGVKTTDSLLDLVYFFEGNQKVKFEQRIRKFIEENIQFFPTIIKNKIIIQSQNNFPHSTGIASSASAFGALSLALLDLEYTLNQRPIDNGFYLKASHVARLGSGSASRSLFPNFALWGAVNDCPTSSNQYAIEVVNIHPVFQKFQDTILIVNDTPKTISSTEGHALMINHPFAVNRYSQAKRRVSELLTILKEGDLDSFIDLCESEALTLHAMMLTSPKYYILMKANTLLAIERLLVFRERSGIPVCFTLDAGPNLHILYPYSVQSEVRTFIESELRNLSKQIIFDEMGNGPIKKSL